MFNVWFSVFSFQRGENVRGGGGELGPRRADTGGEAAIGTRAAYRHGYTEGGVSFAHLCTFPRKSLFSARHFSAKRWRGCGKSKSPVFTSRQMAKFCRQAAKPCREMAELGRQMAQFVAF